MRDRNLSRRMAASLYDPVWRPLGKMTMSGDMPLILLDVVNSVLGGDLRAEWEEECLNLEVCNFEIWKRVTPAAPCRTVAERAQRYAPQPSESTAAPAMAMSLEQTLTVEAAPEEEVAEDTAMLVTPDQSGEHAAELTPNAALVDPIGELTIDTDAETVVPSPADVLR